jgi:stage II sporulation protein P
MIKSIKSRKRSAKRTNGQKSKNRFIPILLAALITSTLLFSVVSSAGSFGNFTGSAAILSAKLSVPQGGGAVVSENMDYINGILTPSNSGHTSEQSKAASSKTSSSTPTPSAVSSSVAQSGIPSGFKPVKTIQLSAQTGGLFENYSGICVDRLTTQVKSADIKKQLAINPDIKINLKNAPQVLIIHTHTTESFISADKGYYDPSAATRDTDKTKSVVRVGDEVAKYLEQNGIGVYHDTEYYDYPDFDGAYGRSLTAIQNDLKKYPSIKVVLDIHRDSIQNTDGTRVKPTIVIGGKKAAQVVIVAGCGEPESAMTVPDWQWNYRFALRIQQQMNKSYADLAMPIELVDKQYNQQVSHGSLLVQIGTDVSTLGEVVYAGQLFGQSLSTVLKKMQ